jgi:hypothetical protein
MSHQLFYAPDRDGDHRWAIRKDGRQLDCELRNHGEAVVEVQLYRDREFLSGRRFQTRALALEEAAARKAQYLSEGGIVTSEKGDSDLFQRAVSEGGVLIA